MRIIISRKGFDSGAGGCPSPILPNGNMVSIPIPDSHPSLTYDDLEIDGISYADIMITIHPQKKLDLHKKGCHVDPDINAAPWKELPKDWVPAFGQIGNAQTVLKKAGVEPGDLFLFFGWFRQTYYNNNGILKYCSPKNNGQDLQIIYGYLEIGSIITDPKEIQRYPWHPHSSSDRLKSKNNVLYLPTNRLSFSPEKPGWGTLAFSKDRILTRENCTRSRWKDLPFLRPENLIAPQMKNNGDPGIIEYTGQWQELVYNGTPEMMKWVKSIIG